ATQPQRKTFGLSEFSTSSHQPSLDDQLPAGMLSSTLTCQADLPADGRPVQAVPRSVPTHHNLATIQTFLAIPVPTPPFKPLGMRQIGRLASCRVDLFFNIHGPLYRQFSRCPDDDNFGTARRTRPYLRRIRPHNSSTTSLLAVQGRHCQALFGVAAYSAVPPQIPPDRPPSATIVVIVLRLVDSETSRNTSDTAACNFRGRGRQKSLKTRFLPTNSSSTPFSVFPPLPQAASAQASDCQVTPWKRGSHAYGRFGRLSASGQLVLSGTRWREDLENVGRGVDVPQSSGREGKAAKSTFAFWASFCPIARRLLNASAPRTCTLRLPSTSSPISPRHLAQRIPDLVFRTVVDVAQGTPSVVGIGAAVDGTDAIQVFIPSLSRPSPGVLACHPPAGCILILWTICAPVNLGSFKAVALAVVKILVSANSSPAFCTFARSQNRPKASAPLS
ncbi:hypothetical protein EIP91_012323, partial [Steccherinum ochraceum]